MRHTSNLEQIYNEITDKDISITDLYIYSLIINDERSFSLDNQEIDKIITKVLNSNLRGALPLTEIVDRLLDNDFEYDEEYDDLWN